MNNRRGQGTGTGPQNVVWEDLPVCTCPDENTLVGGCPVHAAQVHKSARDHWYEMYRHSQQELATAKRERDRWIIRAKALDLAITRHEIRRVGTFLGPRPDDRHLYRIREQAYDRQHELERPAQGSQSSGLQGRQTSPSGPLGSSHGEPRSWYCSCGWAGLDPDQHIAATGHAVRNFTLSPTEGTQDA